MNCAFFKFAVLIHLGFNDDFKRLIQIKLAVLLQLIGIVGKIFERLFVELDSHPGTRDCSLWLFDRVPSVPDRESDQSGSCLRSIAPGLTATTAADGGLGLDAGEGLAIGLGDGLGSGTSFRA